MMTNVIEMPSPAARERVARRTAKRANAESAREAAAEVAATARGKRGRTKATKTTKAKKSRAATPDEKAARKRGREKVGALPTIPIDLPKSEQEALATHRIAAAASALEREEGNLSKARRTWNEQVAKARASLKARIESSGTTKASEARGKLEAVLMAHQDVEETEAGRKMALSELLGRLTQAKTNLRKSFDDAKQLEMKL